MQHRLSAGALIEQDGKLLLVRHVRPGKYDFWVAPGGGVQGTEALQEAAIREVREESGLEIEIDRLSYIEELIQPGLRQCKFWFIGRLLGGNLSVAAPEAEAEHIVEAAWLSQEELRGRTVFPPVLASQYWEDRALDRSEVKHLGLRVMEFW